MKDTDISAGDILLYTAMDEAEYFFEVKYTGRNNVYPLEGSICRLYGGKFYTTKYDITPIAIKSCNPPGSLLIEKYLNRSCSV